MSRLPVEKSVSNDSYVEKNGVDIDNDRRLRVFNPKEKAMLQRIERYEEVVVGHLYWVPERTAAFKKL